MKNLFFISILLICSITVFGQSEKNVKILEEQTKKFDKHRYYQIRYDKFDDQTYVKFVGFNLTSTGESFAEALGKSMGGMGSGSSLSYLMLGAGFIFKTDTLKENQQDFFIYFIYSGDRWKFLKNTNLIMLIDGERVQFGEGEADRDVTRNGVQEIIGFAVNKDTMVKLGKAKTVELKIGNVVKKLKDEHFEMFQNIVKLGDLSEQPAEKKK